MRPLVNALALALLVSTASLAPCAGCRRDVPAPTGTSTTTGNVAPRLSGKPLRIAMIAKSSSNPSFLSARTGAEDRARELSGKIGSRIEIDWLTPSQEDGQVQAQRISQAVNDRFDAILISCSDDQKVSDAIDDAVARGVAVMTFDSDAPASRRFSYCGVDDFKIGERVMAELAAVLAKTGQSSTGKTGKGGNTAAAKVAILAGNRGAPNLRRRIEGAMSEAARHPDVKVIGTFFHAETPQEAIAELMRAEVAFPDISGWAMIGGWPLYTRTLLGDLDPDAGKSRYKIVSVNALPPQLVYVEKGFAPVLLAQPIYLWGAIGVEAIVDKLVLKKDVPQIIPMELVRVTAANLGAWARQLKSWGFRDVPEEYLRLK